MLSKSSFINILPDSLTHSYIYLDTFLHYATTYYHYVNSDEMQGGRVLRSMVASPPNNTTTLVLCDLNSGGPSAFSTSQQDTHSDSSISAPIEGTPPTATTSNDDDSVSSHETWTPSINDDDSQDEDNDVLEMAGIANEAE